jgi:pimeloyl-ACP methyl ester carboxylesterase
MLITIARQAVKVVPDSTALAIVRGLATRTRRSPVSSLGQEAMAQATKLHYGQGSKHVAWAWGSGPLVLFVHGWGGSAAQMAPLAAQVAKLGFRSVAIDVTGHGASPENRTRWEYFLRDIAALSEALRADIYAYVGHSAGALTTMAARKLKGIRAQRYVCLCAPSFPFPPVRAIQEKLNPRQSILDRYKDYLASQFETSWRQLEAGNSYAGAGPEMLLFYDETDRYVSHSEGDRIKSLCPGARLIKTSTYGHVKILTAPEVVRAVGDFLTEGRMPAISLKTQKASGL